MAAKSGEVCPKCGQGRVFVASSIASGSGSQIQYLGCNAKCGFTDKRTANVLQECIRRRKHFADNEISS